MDYLELLRQQRIDDLDSLKFGVRESVHKQIEEVYDHLVHSYYRGNQYAKVAAIVLSGFDITVPTDVFAKFVYDYREKYLAEATDALHMIRYREHAVETTIATFFIINNRRILTPVVIDWGDEDDVEVCADDSGF